MLNPECWKQKNNKTVARETHPKPLIAVHPSRSIAGDPRVASGSDWLFAGEDVPTPADLAVAATGWILFRQAKVRRRYQNKGMAPSSAAAAHSHPTACGRLKPRRTSKCDR